MSIQTISQEMGGTVNINEPPYNFLTVGDIMFSTFGPTFGLVGVAWTGGAAAIKSAILGGPTPYQKWDLISVSIQGYLARIFTSPNGIAFGKFNTILAGISLDPGDIQPNGEPGTIGPPMPPLPKDSSLLSTMWDPSSDPLPPYTPFSYPIAPGSGLPDPEYTEFLPISATISPPVPVELIPGEPLNIGIWMKTALLGIQEPTAPGANTTYVNGLALYGCNYSVTYDDNT